MNNKIILSFILALMWGSCFTGQASNRIKKHKTTVKDTKKSTFVPVPYVNYSRIGGFEFGLVPMGMYPLKKQDTITTYSITGVLGKYSTKKNWMIIAFGSWYFNEDRWRLSLGGGILNNNFQVYSEFLNFLGFNNGYINYSNKGEAFYAELDRQMYKSLYGGVLFGFANVETEFLDLINTGTKKFRVFGFKLLNDTRENKYYPRQGSFAEVIYTSSPQFLDNDYQSNLVVADFNQYIGVVNQRDVLAFRAKVGVGLGDVAFVEQFVVSGTDIRGYTQGRYRGEQMYALQGEYRWNVGKKFSMVGFAGVATINKAVNKEDSGKLLPGGGGGFRINVFPKYHMNVGIDGAVGKDDWGVYFRIGEAF